MRCRPVRGVFPAFLLLALLPPSPVRAEAGRAGSAGTGPPRAEVSREPTWSGSVEGTLYVQEGDDLFVPIVRADRGSLHLEARYQYEDRETFSAWAGWTLATGESLRLEVVPMIGGVVGRTKGIAPGLEISVSWKELELSTEAEYVFDLEGGEGDYFYSWSELAWQASPWLTAGIAAQRTRLHQSDHTLDLGLFAALKAGRWTLKGYGFRLDGGDRMAVVSLAVDF